MRGRLALACIVMAIGVFLVGGVALAATFRGTSGPDEIYGGGGRDTIRGGNGDDRLMAADGRRDTIYCGNGKDFVYADPDPKGPNTLDTVYYGCETVKIERSR